MPRDRQNMSLVLGPQASGLRRTLNPAAWVVLEEMLLRSTAVGEHRVARVSVRSLADSLGLAKDTAARAIRRLRAAGLVGGVQQRTAAGVFDTGVYVDHRQCRDHRRQDVEREAPSVPGRSPPVAAPARAPSLSSPLP